MSAIESREHIRALESTGTRVIVNHCWTGTAEAAWYPHFAENLRRLGLRVEVPNMPHTDTPDPHEWLATLRTQADERFEDLILVGHSLGCANILRFLESLPPGRTVAGVLLVAGLSHDLGIPELRPFYAQPFDYARIRQGASEFQAIISDNDPYAQPHHRVHADVFARELDAQVTVVPGGGHFSPNQPCVELPQAIARVAEMATRQRKPWH